MKTQTNHSSDYRRSTTQISSNNHKCTIDLLPILNILDKCSQILRQDRLWIRNQIKLGNEQALQIFLNAKKPIDMQQLQIKMRKYIKGVKSKAKMQQLLRFKQNLHSGQVFQKSKNKTQKIQNLQRTEGLRQKIINSTNLLNSNNRRGKFSKQLFTSTQKNQKSKPLIYPYRNSYHNIKKAQNFLIGNVSDRINQNIITNPKNKKYQQLQKSHKSISPYKSTSSNYRSSNGSLVYNQWKRPQKTMFNFASECNQTNKFVQQINITQNNYVSNQSSDNKSKIINESKSSNKSESRSSNNSENKSSNKSEIRSSYKSQSRNKSQSRSEDESEYSNNKRESEPQSSIQIRELQYIQRNQQYIMDNGINLFSESRDQSIRQNKQSIVDYPSFQTKRKSQFNQSQQFCKTSNFEAQMYSNDGLFTSPQLLMQCRKYAKCNILQQESRKLQSPFEKSQQQSSLLKLLKQVKNGQQQFRMPLEQKKILSNNFNTYHQYQDEFQTFAIINQQSKEDSIPSQRVTKIQISGQKVIQTLLEFYPNKNILLTNLFTIIENFFPQISNKIVNSLDGNIKQTINIAQIGRILNSKPIEKDNKVFYYFSLYDQDQKGLVSQQNIQNFLNQFKKSIDDEINFQQISECLWRVYMEIVADQNKNTFDYWDFYSIKQTDEFQNMLQVLSPFDFEISCLDE